MTETGAEEIQIKDEESASRYEIRVDGELAGFADYQLAGERIVFSHTEIDPDFGGRGLGSSLVEYAVTDARGRDLEIVPVCPFVVDWIEKNPEQK